MEEQILRQEFRRVQYQQRYLLILLSWKEWDGEIVFEWFNPQQGQITIKIYNVAGELIKQIRGDLSAKILKWDLKTDKGERISGGLYIAVYEAKKMSGEKEKQIRKFSIIRKSTAGVNVN